VLKKLELKEIESDEIEFLNEQIEPFCSVDRDQDLNNTAHKFDMFTQLVNDAVGASKPPPLTTSFNSQSLNRTTANPPRNDYRKSVSSAAASGSAYMNETSREVRKVQDSSVLESTLPFEPITIGAYRKRKLEESILADRSNFAAPVKADQMKRLKQDVNPNQSVISMNTQLNNKTLRILTPGSSAVVKKNVVIEEVDDLDFDTTDLD
jgi:hypothetical protein